MQFAHKTPEGNKPCKAEPELYKNLEDAVKAFEKKVEELKIPVQK